MTRTETLRSTDRTSVRTALTILILAIAGLATAQTMTIAYAPSSGNALVEHGLSGGQTDAFGRYGFDTHGTACRGYIYHRPDHVIRLTARQSSMSIEVESHGDTTLVVYHRETGRVYCDDDSGFGLDAMVSLWNWSTGTYDVYVGSYRREDYHDYTLYVYR